jgi:hypothetical protein
MESHTGRGAVGPSELPAHNWRVRQLTRLGIPWPLAEAYADRTAWHQVARRCNTDARPGSGSASSGDARTLEMTMETVITERSRENMAYVRRLLRQKQPGFSVALELAVLLTERELGAREGGLI